MAALGVPPIFWQITRAGAAGARRFGVPHVADLLASASLPGLSLALMTDTQHASAYLDGRILCTVQRRTAHDAGVAMWRAYRPDGSWIASAAHAVAMVRCVTTYASGIRARGGFPPACVATLAPDYSRRPLALGIVRTANRRAYTLAGVCPGHAFLSLAYLGQPAPTFRRKGDLAEWLALVGLAEGVAVACAGGAA